MHVGSVSVGATPLCAGVATDGLTSTVSFIFITALATLAVPGNYVPWYESEAIDVDVLDEGIQIDVTPNVGVLTE